MTVTMLSPLIGTTSAHAENTMGLIPALVAAWNYLRTRGEYASPAAFHCHSMELPPHTRRIHFFSLDYLVDCGTTSAHAENTGTHPRPRR